MAGSVEVEATPVAMSRSYLFYSCTAETKQDVWPRIWNPCVRNKRLTCGRNDSKRVGMVDTIPRFLMDAFSLDNLL